MKPQQSGSILGSRLRLVRRKGKRKEPKLPEFPKLKITPRFRPLCLAYLAYYYFARHDLISFAATVHGPAKAGDKLFLDYLVKYLKNKPPRFPLSENEKNLVTLYYQKPHLSAQEAMKELGWKLRWEGDTGRYGVTKQRALARSRLMQRILSEGWRIRG
jgi:hypothetical protein